MHKFVITALLTLIPLSSFAIQKGGIEYIPKIDYNLINTSDFEKKAFKHFTIATTTDTEEERIKNIEYALGEYRALLTKHPDNPDYALKLALLYELINKDRYAKSLFYQALSINPKHAQAHEAFGDYYFKKEDYRKALKQYNEAYILNNNIYNVNYKIGVIHQKLGDTRSALKYLRQAQQINTSEELENKIRLLEELNSSNALYYQNTRIHFVED